MERFMSNTQFRIVFSITVLFLWYSYSFAQPQLPQRTLSVTPTQGINFGTLTVTSMAGGTVTVGYDGSRTSSGSIALLSMFPSAQCAIFEIKIAGNKPRRKKEKQTSKILKIKRQIEKVK